MNMSNRNNSPNHDRNGASGRSNDLSQDAADERTVDPQQMTNQEINDLIAHRPARREGEISMLCCAFMIMLCCFVIYVYWPLMIFVLIAYRLIVHDDRTDAAARQRRPGRRRLPKPYRSGWMRDAQVEGRTAQPTEDPILFSSTIQMPPREPLGIQNTQGHDPAVLADLNNAQRADATTANVPNGANLPLMIDENRTLHVLINNPIQGIANTVPAIESQDDLHSSDSSDEDYPSLSTESGNDGDDENDSANNTGRRGQTSPIPRDQSNHTQNYVESTPTNITNDQTTARTNPGPSHNEAQEIEGNFAPPTDATYHAIIRRVHSTCIPLPKTRNLLQLHEESSDESIL